MKKEKGKGDKKGKKVDSPYEWVYIWYRGPVCDRPKAMDSGEGSPSTAKNDPPKGIAIWRRSIVTIIGHKMALQDEGMIRTNTGRDVSLGL